MLTRTRQLVAARPAARDGTCLLSDTADASLELQGLKLDAARPDWLSDDPSRPHAARGAKRAAGEMVERRHPHKAAVEVAGASFGLATVDRPVPVKVSVARTGATVGRPTPPRAARASARSS